MQAKIILLKKIEELLFLSNYILKFKKQMTKEIIFEASIK